MAAFNEFQKARLEKVEDVFLHMMRVAGTTTGQTQERNQVAATLTLAYFQREANEVAGFEPPKDDD